MKKFVIICLEILRRLIDFDLKYQEALKDDASYQKVMGDLKEKTPLFINLFRNWKKMKKRKPNKRDKNAIL